MRHNLLIAAVALLYLSTGIPAQAQQFRYIDSSGNIHFVDSFKQVPAEYRTQIVPPTATPVLDKRALQQKRAAEAKAERDRLAQERRIEQEARRKEYELKRKEEQERKRRELQRRSSSFTGR